MSTTVVGGSFAILSSRVNRFNTSLGGHMHALFKEEAELRRRKGQQQGSSEIRGG